MPKVTVKVMKAVASSGEEEMNTVLYMIWAAPWTRPQ
jgi:hypothetical protein